MASPLLISTVLVNYEADGTSLVFDGWTGTAAVSYEADGVVITLEE